MPAARGVKRSASKASASTASSVVPKSKKKRGPTQLEIPKAPTKRGCVLTCGQGDVGQLGLGEDVTETARFKLVSGLGDKIVEVRAGGMHTIALDSDGKVWTFGCNDEGALGRPSTGDGEEGTPSKVSLPHKAVAIAAGDSHSAALLDSGEVYAWGAFRDSHGSMGLIMKGRSGASCASPQHIVIPEQAVSIASGGDHLVILTISGSVYTLGCGEQGQLGRLSQRSATRDARGGFSALLAPSKVQLKVGMGRVWAGYHATFALDTTNERLFAWGLNNYSQLGISGEKRKVALFSPIECDAFNTSSTLVSVAAGQHHTIALDSEGSVYAVGRCEYGRLGLGEGGDAEALTVIPALQGKRCVSVATGTSNSFAVTDTGEVYAWGMGSESQLGTGKAEDASEPQPAASAALKGLRPLKVAAGGQHTVLLAEDPNRAETKSPTPEPATAPEPVAVPTAKQQKRQKETEVTSTTSEEAEKVNGNEKKEIAMEVDETDNTTQTEKTTTEKEPAKTTSEVTKMDEDPKPEVKQQSEQKTEASEQETNTGEETSENKKPEEKIALQEKTIASQEKTIASQEKTIASQEKTTTAQEKTVTPQESSEKSTDVEMSTEVNGDKETVVTA